MLVINLTRLSLGANRVLRTIPGAAFDPAAEYVQLILAQGFESQRHAFFRIRFVDPIPEYAALEVEWCDGIAVYDAVIVVGGEHDSVGRTFEIDRAARTGRRQAVAQRACAQCFVPYVHPGTGRDGGMLVNHFLQSVAFPEIFGGGDCISFEPQPLAKVGVYAVRQNPILLHNLLSALNGHELRSFVPQKSVLLALNLGDGTAIVNWHAMVWGGKPGFVLKNYIDRKFMKEFQVSGEVS